MEGSGKIKNKKHIYLFFLIISAFLSISLFEVLVVIGILWAVYDIVKNKSVDGSFKIPIGLFSITTVLSTVLFFPKMISKAVEEGVFQLLYFFKVESSQDIIKKTTVLFIGIGTVLTPLVVYNFFTLGKTKPIWGGEFEVGQFYGMFSLMAFFSGLYFIKIKKKNFGILFFVLSILFFAILIIAHKRSPLLGFLVISYLTFFIMYRNSLISKGLFWGLNVILFIFLATGYVYLSKTDHRFIILNEMVIGKKEINFHNLNRFSSARIGIGLDGINIIKTDIKEGNYLNLLIGHGVRSGAYLPHKHSPPNWERYESIFIISEFIEKGLIGLIAVLSIFYLAFKTFLTVRIRDDFDILALGLFVPLLIHLVGSIFTFFWDALLPLYLLLFKIGEMYFENKKSGGI